MAKRVYLSPSNQTKNAYAYGNTTEDVQCGKIARACKAALERNGVEVMLGQYKRMQERCVDSNKFRADLHVPIHTNGFNGKVTGTRIFCSGFNNNSYKASKAVFDVLAPLTPGKSESVKVNTSLYEVRVPKAASVYVECEFHDNAETAKWIIEHTTEIGEAIAKGICNYFGIAFDAATVEAKSIDEVAKEVIQGKWGNGQTRVTKLTEAGYNAAEVQNRVNEMLGKTTPITETKSNTEVAKEVIQGKWDNGQTRVTKLTEAGYDAKAVQAEVNRLLGKTTAVPATKSIDEVAKEVIQGKWGNGQTRVTKLTEAGYNAAEVQNRVNEMLAKG